MELAAVEFDDELLFAVDGVDLVAGYVLVELRERQAVALEEADEVFLEVGLGGAPLGREASGAAARVSGEEGGQLVGRDEPLDLGLVESPGELFGGRTSARSTSVRAGVVTRIPSCVVASTLGERWTWMPRRSRSLGAVTCVGDGQRATIFHSAAAER